MGNGPLRLRLPVSPEHRMKEYPQQRYGYHDVLVLYHHPSTFDALNVSCTRAHSCATMSTSELRASHLAAEDADTRRGQDRTKDVADDDEVKVREAAMHNVLYLVAVNGYSSLVVFALYLISVETLISIGLSVGMTVYAYHQTDADDFDGSIMSWVLLSFAVITPISSVIGMAFQRREAALAHIASMRATFLELFTAHALWDWDQKPGDVVNSGRSKVRLLLGKRESDESNGEVLTFFNECSLFLFFSQL